MTVIRTMAPVHVTVQAPESDAGRAALAIRVAQIHAETVTQRLKALQCPAGQKQELLDAVIEAMKSGPPA